MAGEQTEQKVLESTLDKALVDAILKTNNAMEAATRGTEDSEKKIWAAAEANEYASLIFALAYNLEESRTSSNSRKRQTAEPLAAIQRTREALDTVQTLRRQQNRGSTLEAYGTLRQAAEGLRDAFLSITRNQTRIRE